MEKVAIICYNISMTVRLEKDGFESDFEQRGELNFIGGNTNGKAVLLFVLRG